MLDRYGEGRYALVMTRGSLAIGYGAIVVPAGGGVVGRVDCRAETGVERLFSRRTSPVLRDLGGLVILIITWWWQGGSLAPLTPRD